MFARLRTRITAVVLVVWLLVVSCLPERLRRTPDLDTESGEIRTMHGRLVMVPPDTPRVTDHAYAEGVYA